MKCKIIERVLKDRKVIIGEKRERNMIKKYKNKRNEETSDRGLGESTKRRNIG